MFDYANCPNLLRMFFDRAATFGDKPYLSAKIDGAWQATSWRQAAETVRELARGLAALGVEPGDRIGLIAENRPEWILADFAIMAAGAITVPAYTTNTVSDHRYILANVAAKGVIASTRDLAAKAIEAAQAAGPQCRFVVAINPPPLTQHPGVDVHAWDDVRKSGRTAPDIVDATVARLTRRDVACVIHTSGTGGLPRGVMLSHGAMLFNAMGAEDVCASFRSQSESCLNFLPLSHAYEHTLCVAFMTSIGAGSRRA
jgi:long-chain acyl-CoA synthetase